MPNNVYVVVQSPECESRDEAICQVPPELGVLLAWDRERRAGIIATTDEANRPERLVELYELWGWYASMHTSGTSADADVGRFAEVY